MSDLPVAKILRALDEVRPGGSMDHVHLDEILGALAPPIGDGRWVDVAHQVAELATHQPGRFMVAVPLASDQELPFDFQLSGITDLHRYEPPSVYFVSDHYIPRDWTGEEYRLDLAESTEELLVYVCATRTFEERADAEPFDIRLYFEKR